jgi:hypothetical protein
VAKGLGLVLLLLLLLLRWLGGIIGLGVGGAVVVEEGVGPVDVGWWVLFEWFA